MSRLLFVLVLALLLPAVAHAEPTFLDPPSQRVFVLEATPYKEGVRVCWIDIENTEHVAYVTLRGPAERGPYRRFGRILPGGKSKYCVLDTDPDEWYVVGISGPGVCELSAPVPVTRSVFTPIQAPSGDGRGLVAATLEGGGQLPPIEHSKSTPFQCIPQRAGLGWSERSPKPRTAPHVVEELHTLLTQAGVDPPYVLAGHSMGGAYVRLCAHEYPDQVVGMVLVDSFHGEEGSRYPEAFRQAVEQSRGQMKLALRVPQILSAVGILSQSPEDYPAGSLPPLPPGTEKTYMALLAIDSRFFDTAIKEAASLTETSALMRAAQIGTLGDIPLIVLTAGQLEVPEGYGLSAEEAEQAMAVIHELQAELAALSSNGEQVIAEESGHLVQIDQPELVIETIRAVVEATGR